MAGKPATPALFVTLSSALLLAACANQAATDRAVMAQSALVGMPEPQILSCAGVPNRTSSRDGVDYFTYFRPGSYGSAGPSVGLGIGGGSSSGVGVGVGFGIPVFTGGGSASESCEATFVLRNGAVEQLRYNTRSGYVGACEPIVRNCLPQS